MSRHPGALTDARGPSTGRFFEPHPRRPLALTDHSFNQRLYGQALDDDRKQDDAVGHAQDGGLVFNVGQGQGQGDRDAARKLLTHYAGNRALAALDMGETMAEALDAYTRLIPGRTAPAGSEINTFDPTVNCLADGDPDVPE